MKIWAHTLVKNEARWLWFSVISVIEHVDKILLWDSGSTDDTLEIIEALKNKYPDKILFKKRIINTPEEFPKVRQEMLEATNADWFIVLDGDEVWWKDSINRVIQTINEEGKKYESIVMPMIYPIGDIFHRLEEKAGNYKLAGREGHIALRAINTKIPGLKALKPHGQMGWVDEHDVMIQDRDPQKIKFLDAPYMHFSLIRRSDKDNEVIKRAKKFKYEIGAQFPLNYFYPEAFFKDRPGIVKSPWKTFDSEYQFIATLETPLKIIKRRLFSKKVGY